MSRLALQVISRGIEFGFKLLKGWANEARLSVFEGRDM